MKKRLIVTRKDVCKASKDKEIIALRDLKTPLFEVAYADVIIFKEKNKPNIILKDRLGKYIVCKHRYSRSMNQVYPRLCLKCGKPEKYGCSPKLACPPNKRCPKSLPGVYTDKSLRKCTIADRRVGKDRVIE